MTPKSCNERTNTVERVCEWMRKGSEMKLRTGMYEIEVK